MDASEQQFLSNYWWALTMRGVFAILFGIAAVFWPGITLVTLVYLFSAYILVSGLVEIVEAITAMRHRKTWFLTLLLGFLQIGVGVYLLRNPLVSFATLILLIGFSLIFKGVLEAIAAFSEDMPATMKTLLIIGGFVSVVAGIIVLFQPVAGGVAFVWILGLYALLTGPLLIALSVDAKRMVEEAPVKKR
jgi:uncharacterized membrane protein HdeD (DUF308 family)